MRVYSLLAVSLLLATSTASARIVDEARAMSLCLPQVEMHLQQKLFSTINEKRAQDTESLISGSVMGVTHIVPMVINVNMFVTGRLFIDKRTADGDYSTESVEVNMMTGLSEDGESCFVFDYQ